MKAIAAREAKNRFGNLIDTALREPVAIEKHGRPVAVMMSIEEYKMMKLSKLKAEVSAGLEQLDSGESSEFNEAGLKSLFKDIKLTGQTKRDGRT